MGEPKYLIHKDFSGYWPDQLPALPMALAFTILCQDHRRGNTKPTNSRLRDTDLYRARLADLPIPGTTNPVWKSQ